MTHLIQDTLSRFVDSGEIAGCSVRIVRNDNYDYPLKASSLRRRIVRKRYCYRIVQVRCRRPLPDRLLQPGHPFPSTLLW